jgi:hypothetical protein
MSFVCINSSDDDLDIVLHGSLEQRKRLFKRRAGGAGGESSEDDFEKEMKAELNNTMNKLQASYTSNTRGNCWMVITSNYHAIIIWLFLNTCFAVFNSHIHRLCCLQVMLF